MILYSTARSNGFYPRLKEHYSSLVAYHITVIKKLQYSTAGLGIGRIF